MNRRALAELAINKLAPAAVLGKLAAVFTMLLRF
jgi:hypothetical protein